MNDPGRVPSLKQVAACFIFRGLPGVVMAALAVLAGSHTAEGTDFESVVKPMFEAHCVACHGPDKSKGKITVHTLDGDLAGGGELERWELILEMLESGEMPPEDEAQPDEALRRAVISWIEQGLREVVEKGMQDEAAPTARRLTNFEYQNTMRDLLGIDLHLIDNLPEDPKRPYHFNNTAEYMLIGMEQMDRYKENARRVMASAIVDPEKPEVYRQSRSWEPLDQLRGLGYDEIGINNNRRGAAHEGIRIKEWPETGEFKIRIQASAVLPEGFESVPMRVMGGYGAMGLNLNVYHNVKVGQLNLTNRVDDPQWFEFRGRIENIPVRAHQKTKRGIDPASISFFPENIHDNGRLNEDLDQLAYPRVVVNTIEFEAPLVDVWPPEHHTRILFESPLRESDPDKYVREVLKRFMSRAFRRPATGDEVDRFFQIYGVVSAEMETFEDAMRETLAMVLISPQFLYHTEGGDGAGEEAFGLASRLSYFLWGSMPDTELLDLAASGELDNPGEIEAQVKRMLGDPRTADFVKNFTVQWLDLEKMKTIKINRSLFPMFLYMRPGREQGDREQSRPSIRDYMEEETIGFVAELIRRNASVTELVDSEFAFLNEPLAEHYGVAGVSGVDLRAVAIKPEHRLGGLLTHGSVLIGNGNGSAPHPIYRAVWLREAILGDEVKPPPADVPALEETAGEKAATAATIKEALQMHRKKESCNDCHVRLDPWGIPFEQYNAIGRYQPKIPEAGHKVRGYDSRVDADGDAYREAIEASYTVEVEANARVPHGPEVDGMEELKAYLLRDRRDDIAENVIRRLMTYALGRELTYRDRFEIEDLLESGIEKDFRFQELIVAICQSSVFRNSPLNPPPNP